MPKPLVLQCKSDLSIEPLLEFALLLSCDGEIIVHTLHLLGELSSALLFQARQECLFLLFDLTGTEQSSCQLLTVELAASIQTHDTRICVVAMGNCLDHGNDLTAS